MKRALAAALYVTWFACAQTHSDPHAAAPPRTDAPPSAHDAFLEAYAATQRFTLGRPRSARLVPDGSAVLFLRSPPRSPVRDLYVLDTRTGRERVIVTAEALLRGDIEQLSPEERARRERTRTVARGIAGYDLSRDGRTIVVAVSGRVFVVSREDGRVVELPSQQGAAPPIDPRLSPDATHVAMIRAGDLYVADVAARTEKRLTQRSRDTLENGTAEFVAQEEMHRSEGYWWSPDSRAIAYQETDNAAVERLYVSDLTHPERPPSSTPYPRPGKSNAAVRLGVIAVTGGTTRWIEWDHARYPYLVTVRWSPNAPLTLVVQNREQTEEAILVADPATGATQPIHVERDEAWINIAQSVPRWLRDGQSFLWMTERGGAWQLELRARNGSLLRTLTDPGLGLRDLLHVDERVGADATFAYVLASAEPTEAHVFRVALSTARASAPDRITRERGEHGAVFASESDVYVDELAGVSDEGRMVVRDGRGRELATVRSEAESLPFIPRVELTSAGERRMRAAIIRPRRFDRRRVYPVLASVYAGPGARVVTAVSRRYLLEQWLADHGFIVVAIDGRGTPGRGRAWERAIRGNLIDIALEDQTAALRALGRAHPEMDMSRVGAFGWSFGGYVAAMAVMRRPDVFHAAVAGAPVADWRDYDTHYTERFLGLPQANRTGYDRSSVLTYASALRRPLLLVHGTADDNVYFAHTLKISDALLRTGRPHEVLPLSGLTHMVPDPIVTVRLYTRIATFLEEHLRAGGVAARH